LSSPFSAKVCRAIAVEDMAKVRPMAMPRRQSRPKAKDKPAMPREVPSTCSPPSPKIGRRNDHNRAGRSSRPTKNNIITTPNSAKCMTWASPPIRPRTVGPKRTPAIR
jgi:hypothetical protein